MKIRTLPIHSICTPAPPPDAPVYTEIAFIPVYLIMYARIAHRLCIFAALFGIVGLCVLPVSLAAQSGILNVSVNVARSCTVTSVSDPGAVTRDPAGAQASPPPGTNRAAVQCGKNVPYAVVLGQGLGVPAASPDTPILYGRVAPGQDVANSYNNDTLTVTVSF
jgi:spore coat protein U-like protein